MSTDIRENPAERARANARMAQMRSDLSPAQKNHAADRAQKRRGRWSRAPNGWAPSCFITERDAWLCWAAPIVPKQGKAA